MFPDDVTAREAALAALADRREVCVRHASELQKLAVFARATAGDEFAYLEIATLFKISGRAAQDRLGLAVMLTERLPRTLAAMHDGVLDERKAQLIANAVFPLTDEHATAVEDRVLAKAGDQSPAQLRAALGKAVLAVDPQGAEERRQDKKRERRVNSQPTEDGQGVLSIYHDAARIAMIRAALRGRAHQLRADPDESRTLDQIEADLACDLLLEREEGLRAVQVHVTMPATTAQGRDEQPAEFEGVGPVTAAEAREWMAEATSWRWLRTDPGTGEVVDLTSESYRPPASLATFVKVRDRTCRFPGCVRPARGCEVDHRTPWPTGKTCAANCGCLCKRHHRAKTKGGWRLETIKPGVLRWTSPRGFTHDVTPEPVTEPEPPPF